MDKEAQKCMDKADPKWRERRQMGNSLNDLWSALNRFRQGWRDMLAGRGTPLATLWDEDEDHTCEICGHYIDNNQCDNCGNWIGSDNEPPSEMDVFRVKGNGE